jgi:glutamate-1-semialdehyde 2,1-aminomutase
VSGTRHTRAGESDEVAGEPRGCVGEVDEIAGEPRGCAGEVDEVAGEAQRRAEALHERAVRVLPRGNTRTTLFVPPHPPYVARGEGCRMVDVDGHETIDLQGNYTALIHGHAHPRIVAAAEAAMRDGASFGLPTPWEVDLAEELARRVPAGERWRFANSGTEAVMMAVRVARAATGRDMVLRFEGAYHGSADVVAGGPGITAGVAQEVVVVPVGDEPAFEAALERHGERLAAVLFDAMPNRAGLRPADPAFVTRLREATAERGILLIADEVLTFRLAPGGLHSLYGITPDLVTLGKVIGGGFPVGAIGGRADVMARFDPSAPDSVGHGGTFTANPVTMRAGLASLELLTPEEIDRINGLGDRLRASLGAQGWEVTGRGSLLRVHTADPRELWWRLYRQGVAIAVNGLACLSTAMDEATIDEVEAAFEAVR